MTAGLAQDLAGALGDGSKSWRDRVIDRVNGGDKEFQRRVLRALSPEELDLLIDATEMQGKDGAVWDSARGWRALRPVERAIRRVDLGLDQPRSGVVSDGSGAKRLSQGTCWFGSPACRCLDRALEFTMVDSLGRVDVRKVARRLHGPWRRSRLERRALRRVRRAEAAEKAYRGAARGVVPRTVTASSGSERFVPAVAYEPAPPVEVAEPVRRPRRRPAYEVDAEVRRLSEVSGLPIYDGRSPQS